MTQFALPVIDPNVTTGTDLANFLNSWNPALLSSHGGAARPAYAVPGTLWVQVVSGTVWRIMLYTGTVDVQVAQFNPVTGIVAQQVPLSRRNAIIGGDFNTNPWQRGISFAAVIDHQYTADRFMYTKAGAMVHTIDRQFDGPTDVQAGRVSPQCFNAVVTTVDAAIAAADFCAMNHLVEAWNWVPLNLKPAVMTFWHKATKVGTYCVSFRNSAQDQSFVAEYQQLVSNAWEFAQINIPAVASVTGWPTGSGIGLWISWALAAGSTLSSPLNANWQSGNFIATPAQVNACDTVGNLFRVNLVQLEGGSVPTPFEFRFGGDEIDLCQRYYERKFEFVHGHVAPSLLTQDKWAIRFKTKKRQVPLMRVIPGASLANAIDEAFVLTRTPTGFTFSGTSLDACNMNSTGVTYAATNNQLYLNSDCIEAEAELGSPA